MKCGRNISVRTSQGLSVENSTPKLLKEQRSPCLTRQSPRRFQRPQAVNDALARPVGTHRANITHNNAVNRGRRVKRGGATGSVRGRRRSPQPFGSESEFVFSHKVQQQLLLVSLDALLQSDAVRAGHRSDCGAGAAKAVPPRAAAMAWGTHPAVHLRPLLAGFHPLQLGFILRAWAHTGAERHPNSHQRTMSFRGIGDLQTGDDGHWQSNLLISNREAPSAQRWVTIPPNVWRSAIVADSDWVVGPFQTVSAEELIEERPDPTDASRMQQRKYVVPNK